MLCYVMSFSYQHIQKLLLHETLSLKIVYLREFGFEKRGELGVLNTVAAI